MQNMKEKRFIRQDVHELEVEENNTFSKVVIDVAKKTNHQEKWEN
jgi:hypothetical protein|tara:strand:+ start:201 stop:335 length:135 start_codon:yes stop_codon:yes gene_type:complete